MPRKQWLYWRRRRKLHWHRMTFRNFWPLEYAEMQEKLRRELKKKSVRLVRWEVETSYKLTPKKSLHVIIAYYYTG